MTRNEAFEHCLENAIKPNVTKGVWASYKFRFKDGVLKEKTIIELLQKYGYSCVQEEKWISNNQTNMSFLLAKFDENTFEFVIKNVEAASIKEAVRINNGGIDISNNFDKFCKFVNQKLEELKQ